MQRCGWLGVFGVVVAVSWTADSAARAPLAPLELAIHQPASLVRILGRSVLVHELWIVNRSGTPATLRSVTVKDGSRAIIRYEGADLAPHVGRPDLPRNHPTPLILGAGQSAVVYFWLPLSPRSPAPRQIDHHVVASSGSATDSTAIVEGAATQITPASAAVVIDPPLRGAGWAAVYEPAMMGGHRTAVYTTDGAARIPGRFAVDWIRVLPEGRAHSDVANRPDDWNGFGADVLAVADARVADAVDGRPDADRSGTPRETVTRDNAAGNYVALDLGRGRYAFYEHLQHGSVAVKAGEHVRRGQVIARVGSSGSVSSGPHLHFHVSNALSLLGAEGVPFVLRVFHLRGAFASISAFAKSDRFVDRDAAIAARRERERPAPNAVVDFPEQQ